MGLFDSIRAALSGNVKRAVNELTGRAERERQQRQEREADQRRRTEAQQEYERPKAFPKQPQAAPKQQRSNLPNPDSGFFPSRTYKGPRDAAEEQRLRELSLAILTTDPNEPVVRINASEIPARDRLSLADYWLQVELFSEGLADDIGEWTDGNFRIKGYDIETDLDVIRQLAGDGELIDISDGIYQEVLRCPANAVAFAGTIAHHLKVTM